MTINFINNQRTSTCYYLKKKMIYIENELQNIVVSLKKKSRRNEVSLTKRIYIENEFHSISVSLTKKKMYIKKEFLS